MARRKTKKHHRRHHRRGMGRIGGLDLKTPALATLGAVGGTYIINGPMKTTSWVNIGVIAAGVLLPKFVKNPAMVPIGAGLVAAGGISILQNANVISGVRTMGRVMVGPGRPLKPISAVAGIAAPPNQPGTMTQRQLNAELNRRHAAQRRPGRVIMGTTGGSRQPISSVAGFDDTDL